jgi:hypothetical protein
MGTRRTGIDGGPTWRRGTGCASCLRAFRAGSSNGQPERRVKMSTSRSCNHIPLLALLLVMAIAGRCQSSEGRQASKPCADRHDKHAVAYVNGEYGFRFDLPDDWRGFRIEIGHWGSGNEAGPFLRIRNPRYTISSPTEDIPIMIFTHREWKRVISGDLLVSAAPFPPSEIASNSRYVFALPPRWDYDELDGVEEASRILGGKAMHTFVPRRGACRACDQP